MFEVKGVRCTVPARAALLGNPTDIYGGQVLACTVSLRAVVEIYAADESDLVFGQERVPILSRRDLEQVGDRFDLLRAALRLVSAEQNCRLVAKTEIPETAGLAGSAALILATLGAIHAFTNKSIELLSMIKMARSLEMDALYNFCGWNDFVACAVGGVNLIDYFDSNDVEPRPKITPIVFNPSDVSFLVGTTGGTHRSGLRNSDLKARWEEGDALVRSSYGSLMNLATKGVDALQRRDWRGFGKMMSENFVIQYRLGSASAIEQSLVERANSLGAFGAKLCGAGHCGSIVLLTSREKIAAIREGLQAFGVNKFFEVAPVRGFAIGRL
jgi:galactokinase/mevalonate kinase-like predicted kinase